jgi:hypothetical protein
LQQFNPLDGQLLYNEGPGLAPATGPAVKETTPKKGNPPLDEDSFQQLLAAAHVLQEHGDRQKMAAPSNTEQRQSSQPESAPTPTQPSRAEPVVVPDYSATLAEIVATQRQIQMSHLDLEDAMNLVAERTQKIADADAAVIGLLEQDELIYRAASGSAAHLLGAKVHANACLSMGCLLHGATVQCPDVTADATLGPDFCREFGIQALIAVPIFSEGNVIGSLEVHFAAANAFQEHDIRTCQLMAGLVTEAKARSAEAEWKQALATERATMLEALERLKPQLQRLASEPEVEPSHTNGIETGAGGNRIEEKLPATAMQGAGPAVKETICNGCGNALEPAQIFCGICGTERNQPPAGNIQSKWASMWQLSQAQLDRERAEAVLPQHEVVLPELRRHTPGAPHSDFILPEKTEDEVRTENATVIEGDGRTARAENALHHEPPALPWPGVDHHLEQQLEGDAEGPEQATEEQPAEAEDEAIANPTEEEQWLKEAEELKSGGALVRFLKERRADIYLAAALVIVTGAIFWIVRENSEMVAGAGAPGSTASAAVAPTSRKRQAQPEQKLSLMDQLLVSMGVAEAPAPPAYMGNPDTKVWVDLHTALYYCPGSDVYGKTPKGKFTSQRDAQLDQFEPAYRKVCD